MSAMTNAMTLFDTRTEIRRPVTLLPDDRAAVVTWVTVQQGAGADLVRETLPVLLLRDADGAVRLVDLGAAPAFAPLGAVPQPPDLGVDLPRDPPPTMRDDALLRAAGVRALCAGEHPDLARLFADLAATVTHFVAFPTTGAATPADYAAFMAAYAISTYLLPAFPAVGYPYFTGLKGSGKSTALHWLARVACLPLIASESSILPSLRGHADAGGVCLLDNFEAVAGKDDAARALRSFIEMGYQRGGVATLQVQAGGGRGWITLRCHVYANRAFSAVAEPPDAIASRCITITMLRTADPIRASRTPLDDDEWPTPPAALVQALWGVALHALAPAAAWLKTVTTASTGLTNRDLQTWRPALTVARMVDAARGDTAVWDALVRLAGALLVATADTDSREALVTRLLDLMVQEGLTEVSASVVLEALHALAAREDRDLRGLDTQVQVGRLLMRMGVPQAQRHTGRRYLLSADLIAHLRAVYLPPPPSPPAAPAARYGAGARDRATDATDATAATVQRGG